MTVTHLRTAFEGGVVRGSSGSVWVYRSVPLSPVEDAVTVQASVDACDPLQRAFEEIAASTKTVLNRRQTSAGNYSEFHLLLVNVDRPFRPSPGPLQRMLTEDFGRFSVMRRELLLGIRIPADQFGAGGWRKAVHDVTSRAVFNESPIEDFGRGIDSVASALSRAGLSTPTPELLRFCDSWWDRANLADVPMVETPDSLHVFRSGTMAAAFADTVAESKREPDSDELDSSGILSSLTMCSVYGFDFGDNVTVGSWGARWVSQLVTSDAAAVSFRGRIEPATVTRNELRRNRKRIESDQQDRASAGQMDKSEQDELEADLMAIESGYGLGGAPATLTSCSVTVALHGCGMEVEDVGRESGVSLAPMTFRQMAALETMMIGSTTSGNPHVHDLPSHAVSASGIVSLSRGGDRTGALLGFTERDRQPYWFSPTAASRDDSAPFFLGAGASGSGKSLLMMWLAYQLSLMCTPTIVIDPKAGSDFSAVVDHAGGRSISLDELLSGDGIFDPLRFAVDPVLGVEIAAATLMAVNPWGSGRENWETDLSVALTDGVRLGGTCVGHALKLAAQAQPRLQLMVDPVIRLAESSPMFRACVGLNESSDAPRLRASEGLTYIRVGNAHLNLPSPSDPNPEQPQRIAAALVRQMVFGSAMALSGRDGVCMFDEGWVVLQAGGAEVDRLSRVARSQRVLPMIFTQFVTDAEKSGLRAGSISRGVILANEDPDEAASSCRLWKLEPTPARVGRITAKKWVGGHDGERSPNWNSLRALTNPGVGGGLARGSVGISVDLAGQALPVEVTIPPWFLALASTSPDDVDKRRQARSKLQ